MVTKNMSVDEVAAAMRGGADKPEPERTMPVKAHIAPPSQSSELGEVHSLAMVFVQSGLFQDTKSVSQAMVKILAGKELGIGPFASMRDVYIIQGKVALAGAQIAARIKSSGRYNYKVLKFADDGCVLRFFEDGTALVPDIEFNLDHAKSLGFLNKDNYQKQARTMLFWRALTMGGRMFCADLFNGAVYTPDELKPGQAVVEAPIAEIAEDAETLRN